MMELNFEKQPFGVTPDPSMVFPAAGFQEAREAILEALASGKGFIVVTGEVGAGKTTLLRTLLSDPPPNLEVGVILNTGLGPDELLLAVARDLQIEIPQGATRQTVVAAIEEKLLATFTGGKSTVIFIDEAQHLSDESLELLRMLSNIETESDKLVQIALFGQVELKQRLGRPELRQLRSRVAVHRHMEPLSPVETANYVRHRLAQAGSTNPVLFEPAALTALHRASGGFPRRINLIADLALRMSVGAGRDTVNSKSVHAAARELATLEPAIGAGLKTRWPLISTIAAWLVLAAAVFLFFHQRTPSAPVAPRTPLAPTVSTPVPSKSGSALFELFRLAGVNPRYDAGALEHADPVALAASLNLRWIEIPAATDLLRGIGLPTLVFVRQLGGEEVPALVTPLDYNDSDRISVMIAGGAPVAMRWSDLALARRSAGAIIPLAKWNGTALTIGAASDDVKRLQVILKRIGAYDAVPSGRFGAATLRAVRIFQADRNIGEDGIVGPLTISALHAWEKAHPK